MSTISEKDSSKKIRTNPKEAGLSKIHHTHLIDERSVSLHPSSNSSGRLISVSGGGQSENIKPQSDIKTKEQVPSSLKAASSLGEWKGKEEIITTPENRKILVWKPDSSVTEKRLKYWCHGFALDTFKIEEETGYTVNGFDVNQYLDEFYTREGEWKKQDTFGNWIEAKNVKEGDIVVFIGLSTGQDKKDFDQFKKTKKLTGESPTEVVLHTAKIDSIREYSPSWYALWRKDVKYVDSAMTQVIEKPGRGEIRRISLAASLEGYKGLKMRIYRRKGHSNGDTANFNLVAARKEIKARENAAREKAEREKAGGEHLG